MSFFIDTKISNVNKKMNSTKNAKGLKRMRKRNVKYLHYILTKTMKDIRRDALKVFHAKNKNPVWRSPFDQIKKIRVLPLSGYIYWKFRVDRSIRKDKKKKKNILRDLNP